jgi:hypothetical protein
VGLLDYIFHDGCKGISHGIMGHHPFPTMNTMKEVNPHGLKVGHKCKCDKPRAHGWGRPNLVRITEEKMFKAQQKKG